MLEFFPNTGDRLLLVGGQSFLGALSDGPASSAEPCAIVNPRLAFLASRAAPLYRTRLAGPGAVQCNSSPYPETWGNPSKQDACLAIAILQIRRVATIPSRPAILALRRGLHRSTAVRYCPTSGSPSI